MSKYSEEFKLQVVKYCIEEYYGNRFSRHFYKFKRYIEIKNKNRRKKEKITIQLKLKNTKC